MDYIHKLPFLLGGFMAVIVGIISYGSGSQKIYLHMAVVMVVFYIIGIYVRNTVKAINDELLKKKEQELINLQNESVNELDGSINNANQSVHQQEQRLDLVADDSSEELSPLVVSRVISAKTKE